MGAPRFRWDEIPLAKEMRRYARDRSCDSDRAGAPILRSPSAVSMGNPHAIFWVDDPQAYDLRRIGPLLEHHPLFPERANITLAGDASRDHIVIRTWERGAGLTKACGSAACAAAVAAARLARTGRKVTVTLPGGDLAIEWREARRPCADDRAGRVRVRRPLRCRACSPARDAAMKSDERRRRHLRLPAQCRRVGSDPPRSGARRLARHGGGQYLRGDRRSRAPGAANDPRAAARARRTRKSSSPAARRRPSRKPLSP